MARISMDLEVDPRDGPDRRGLTLPMRRAAMTEACVEVMRLLGKYAHAIEAFRVVFSKGNSGNPNCAHVEIGIHFADPLGKKCSHTTTYDIGPHVDDTTYREIARHIMHGEFLEGSIRDHIERGRKDHERVGRAFAKMK